MPRTVSASEAKTQFGAILDWTVENKDDVIVESHGKPKAVIISFEEYQKVAELREQARRKAIWEELEQLRKQVSSRNTDLSDEEAMALADQLTRDAIDKMIAEGKVKYQEQ